jgi:hypothetical protein
MIPIKIRCGCGQKYAFDVEPVGGLMTHAVLCPVCGVDGTAMANELIGQQTGISRSSTPVLRLGRHDLSPTAQPPIPRHLPRPMPARRAAGSLAKKNWGLPVISTAFALVLIVAWFFARGLLQSPKPANPIPAANDGLPHTLAELNAWYVEPPAGQNAATYFSQGFNALRVANLDSSGVPVLGKGKLPPLGSSMPASMKSTLATIVGSNREALQLFTQGSKFEQSRFPVDLSLGIDVAFPHLNKILEAGRVLELAAVVHAEAGDTKSTVNDVWTALALASSLKAEPYLFSQFVRTRVEAIAIATLEQSVNRIAWPAESSGEVLRVLQKMEDYDARGEAFSRSVAGERVNMTALLGKPEQFLQLLPTLTVDIPASQRDRMAARLQSGKLQADEHCFQAAVQQLLTVRQGPFPDRLKADDLVRREINEAAGKDLVLAEFLLSGLKTAAAKEAECLVSLRLGMTAMALEQFRATHDNRYPATLAEITSGPSAAASVDPFDGQPLRYRKKGSGYLLYSIGPDLKDDGGERKVSKNGDIVFEVVTPGKLNR